MCLTKSYFSILGMHIRMQILKLCLRDFERDAPTCRYFYESMRHITHSRQWNEIDFKVREAKRQMRWFETRVLEHGDCEMEVHVNLMVQLAQNTAFVISDGSLSVYSFSLNCASFSTALLQEKKWHSVTSLEIVHYPPISMTCLWFDVPHSSWNGQWSSRIIHVRM